MHVIAQALAGAALAASVVTAAVTHARGAEVEKWGIELDVSGYDTPHMYYVEGGFPPDIAGCTNVLLSERFVMDLSEFIEFLAQAWPAAKVTAFRCRRLDDDPA